MPHSHQRLVTSAPPQDCAPEQVRRSFLHSHDVQSYSPKGIARQETVDRARSPVITLEIGPYAAQNALKARLSKLSSPTNISFTTVLERGVTDFRTIAKLCTMTPHWIRARFPRHMEEQPQDYPYAQQWPDQVSPN